MDELRPEVAAAARALFQASALLDPIRLRLWDEASITVTQMRLLGHLLEAEPLSNADLAERLYVTRPSVSALLERLERGAYIRREVDPSDRRGICIWLEPKGREVVESLRQEIREYAAGLMDCMNDEQLAEFTRAVSAFIESGRSRRARDLAAENAHRAEQGAT